VRGDHQEMATPKPAGERRSHRCRTWEVAVIDSKHWSGMILVIAGCLRCDDEEHQEAVEKLLVLTTAVEELLVDLGAPPAEPSSSVVARMGLPPVHMLPVLRELKQLLHWLYLEAGSPAFETVASWSRGGRRARSGTWPIRCARVPR
jgi:hypothetical protein